MSVAKMKLGRARRKITGHFHNMVSCRIINGKQTQFCINKNVWDTEWLFFKAWETRLCQHIDEEQCSVLNCPQKAAHDKYMKLKNSLQGVAKQKEK